MKKMNLFIISFCFLFCSLTYSQEIPVPLDTSGKVLSIDKELSKKLKLYPEYSDLQEVLIYKINDNQYALEIYFNDSIFRKKNRIILDENQYRDFKQKISEQIFKSAPEMVLERSGRAEFISTITFLSLGVWGPSVPLLIKPNDLSTGLGSYLLSAGIGFMISYGSTYNSNISKGLARFSSIGGLLGTYHGITFVQMFLSDDIESEQIGLGMLGGSIIELLINYNIAKKYDFSFGRSNALSNYAIFGSGFGPLISNSLGFFDGASLKNYSITTLATSALGYYLGSIITKGNYYNDGDANVLTNSAIIGGALPMSLMVLFDNGNSKSITNAMIGGSIIGIAIGDYLAKKINLSESQGNYLSLAFLGGALIGTGFGLLVSPVEKVNPFHEETDYKYVPILGTLGGFGIFSLLLSHYWDSNKDPKYSDGLRIDVNPAGLASIFSRKLDKFAMPLLNINYQFK
jgi:hypothetical protein